MIAGVASTVLLAAAVWLGAAGASWWAVPALAAATSLVYVWMRRQHIALHAGAGGRARDMLIPVYPTQCVLMATLFALGHGIGWAF